MARPLSSRVLLTTRIVCSCSYEVAQACVETRQPRIYSRTYFPVGILTVSPLKLVERVFNLPLCKSVSQADLVSFSDLEVTFSPLVLYDYPSSEPDLWGMQGLLL